MSDAATRTAVCAALLLILTMSALPALASCPASCPAPAAWSQPFPFAGLQWERKEGCGGPGPNCWAPANVELVPGEGIRLRLTRTAGRWYAAEIRTAAPVPHGSYSFQLVGRPDLLDPNVVLGVFLYDDAAGDAGDPCPAELDLESSCFGDASAANGHFVSYGAGLCGAEDLLDFSYGLGGTYTTHQIDWAPGAVSFRLLHGHRCAAESPAHLIAERTYASSLIPAAGGMRLHVNLWAFAGLAPTDQQDVDVTIRNLVTDCGAVAAAPVSEPPALDLAVRRDPSGGSADLHFTLEAPVHARLTVVDVSGRVVARLVDAELPPGAHRARWESAEAASGVYFARLEVADRSLSRRIVIVH
jgi:hypothetical protein